MSRDRENKPNLDDLTVNEAFEYGKQVEHSRENSLKNKAIAWAAQILALTVAYNAHTIGVTTAEWLENHLNHADEQMSAQNSHISPALARAATLEIVTLCNFSGDDGAQPIPISEGTGALYQNQPGDLRIGTVQHVVEGYYDISGNSQCQYEVIVATAHGKTDAFILPQAAWRYSYPTPRGNKEYREAADDQPVFASLTGANLAKMQKMVRLGKLKPLIATESATEEGTYVVRPNGSAGPTSMGSNVIGVTNMKISNTDSVLLDYKDIDGTNTCHGNSGSPVLRVVDGRVTNQAFGVMESMMSVGGDLRCGTRGTVTGFIVLER